MKEKSNHRENSWAQRNSRMLLELWSSRTLTLLSSAGNSRFYTNVVCLSTLSLPLRRQLLVYPLTSWQFNNIFRAYHATTVCGTSSFNTRFTIKYSPGSQAALRDHSPRSVCHYHSNINMAFFLHELDHSYIGFFLQITSCVDQTMPECRPSPSLSHTHVHSVTYSCPWYSKPWETSASHDVAACGDGFVASQSKTSWRDQGSNEGNKILGETMRNGYWFGTGIDAERVQRLSMMRSNENCEGDASDLSCANTCSASSSWNVRRMP